MNLTKCILSIGLLLFALSSRAQLPIDPCLSDCNLGQELTLNGDFEQGTTGINGNFTYGPNNCGPGWYAIGLNQFVLCNAWSGYIPAIPPVQSPANDNYMIIDGFVNTTVWTQSFSFFENASYYFSFDLYPDLTQLQAATIRPSFTIDIIDPTGNIVSNLMTINLDLSDADYTNGIHNWNFYCTDYTHTSQTGSYSLQITQVDSENTGCDYGIDNISLKQLLPINVQIDPFVQECAGDPITLSASADVSGATLTWTDPQGNIVGVGSPITVAPLVPITYTVTATANGGCSGSDDVTVTPIQGPQTLFQTIDLCESDAPVVFFETNNGQISSGSITVLADNPTPQAAINMTTISGNLATFSFDPAVAGPGIHTVNVCYNKKKGCCTTVTFYVCPVPTVNLSYDCSNNSITAISGIMPTYCTVDYTWSGPGVNGSTGPSINPGQAGTYSVTAVVNNNQNCSYTTSITIGEMLSVESITISDEAPCEGTPVTLTANAIGGESPITYNWDLDNDGQFDDATGMSVTTTNSGIVCVQAIDANGCEAVLCTEVTFSAAPTINVTGCGTSCEGDGVLMFATVNEPCDNLTWQWYADGQPITGATSNVFIDNYPEGTVIGVEACCDGCCTMVNVDLVITNETVLDDQQIELFDFDCNTNMLSFTLEDGGTATADLSCLDTDTDDQIFTDFSLNGTNLSITIEDGNTVDVDLASLQNGVGTDDQNLTNATLNGTNLTIEIENGASVTVDLSALDTDTDEQDLTSATLDPQTNILTIDIENGAPVSVDLSALANSSSLDADWHNSAPGSQNTPPTSINDNIYTMGNVGINNVSAQEQFSISTNGQSFDPFRISGTNARFHVAQEGNIGIGYSATNTALINATNAYLASPIGHGFRLQFQNLDVGSGGVASGIYLVNNSPSEDQAAGVHATAAALKRAYGVQGISYGSGETNYGVYGTARNGSVNSIGVYGAVPGGESYAPSSYTSALYGSDASQLSKDKRGLTTISNYTMINNQPPVGVTTYGVYAIASGGNINYGGRFRGNNHYLTTNAINYGVHVSAAGSSATNYGIHSTASGASSTNYAGFFVGDVNVNGALTVMGVPVVTSDSKFKKDVKDIDGATDVLMKLKPKTYTFKTDEYAMINFESDQQMGLIAQEVEKVIPTIVSDQIYPAQYDSLGNQISEELHYKGVQYSELIPLLIAGMQEQQNEIAEQKDEIQAKDELIEDLNSRLSKLENCLSNILPVLCEINHNMIEQNDDDQQEALQSLINVELNDRENIILNQNVPNPFAETTLITYFLPDNVQKAQIHFHDGQGNLINSIDLQERGAGRLNVFANDLSTGNYTYSLVADGKVVITKHMTKL